MKLTILRYIVIFSVCVASFFAYRYLNSVIPPDTNPHQASLNPIPKEKAKYVYIKDPKTNKTHLVIIEAQEQDSVVKPKVEQKIPPKDKSGMLPDVEFLKFVLQKSKEGIPVLGLGDFFKL